jgi:hypothetical protein
MQPIILVGLLILEPHTALGFAFHTTTPSAGSWTPAAEIIPLKFPTKEPSAFLFDESLQRVLDE